MAIEVTCDSCHRTMMVKDSCAGKTGLCPHCKATLIVPPVAEQPSPEPVTANEAQSNAEEFLAPTERQIAYAQKLGIAVPKGVSRQQLSLLIDCAKESAPATESQKAYLRDLGVKFPDDIKANQIGMLLDAATDIRDQIAHGVHKQYEEQLKEAGMLVEQLNDEQLLDELSNRGKLFFVFLMDDDEFRYQENLPMKGHLRWTDSLNEADVKYILASLAVDWARNLDMNASSEEFDNSPPHVEFTASELKYKGTVVHLSISPFGPESES